MKEKLSTLVLAGGESSRMGQDKALLKVEGLTMLERMCLLTKGFAEDVYVLTFWPDRYQSILPINCQLIQERRTSKICSTHGPLIGFAQALRYVKTEWVLLLACDLPKLTTDFLLQGYESLPSGQKVMAYLPRTENRWEPLCGFYHYSCLAALKQYLKDGGDSFQGWLGSIVVKEWVAPNGNFLLNCNTAEDFQELE
jgi:molybdopterin-guanine dinucleotide biosynthesis protein A